MRYFVGIFSLAAMTAFMLICGAMVVFGILHRRIGTESSSPPVRFEERPIAFVNLILWYLTAAALVAKPAFQLTIKLLDGP